jgi:hypothetical protein
MPLTPKREIEIVPLCEAFTYEGSDIVTLPAGDGSLRKWSWYFHDGAEGRG